jgi:GNAT superfamily N-acetyltransferase
MKHWVFMKCKSQALPGQSALAARQTMIRRCTESDLDEMYAIINDAAQAYRGLIPDDRWHEPYMPMEELGNEIRDGVEFWGLEEDCELAGVMGIQDRGVVTLMRHAYVRTARRKRGIGTRLLRHLEGLTHKPILIGTWAAAIWAVRFYEKNGYTSISRIETERLLRLYWNIPERQIATSVVLANADWKSANQGLHDIVA